MRVHGRRQNFLQGRAKIEAPSGERRRREVEAPQFWCILGARSSGQGLQIPICTFPGGGQVPPPPCPCLAAPVCEFGCKFVSYSLVNRKLHTGFRLVPSSMTLKGLKGRNDGRRALSLLVGKTQIFVRYQQQLK